MRIWLDAHACPPSVRQVVFETANHRRIPVVLVGSSTLVVPRSPYVTTVEVGSPADPATHYLVANPDSHDVVVTDNLLLAEALLAKGVTVLHPRGEEIGPDDIDQWPISRGDTDEALDQQVSRHKMPAEQHPKYTHQFSVALAARIANVLPPR